MRMIWSLMALAVLAVLGWGGYWFAGARALDRTVDAMLAGDPGLSAEGHVVRGFPNRFDLTLTEPRLQRPGFSWQAPFLQVFALSYRPHHLIAVFPHDQAFTADDQDIALNARDMRASLVMAPTPALPLERLALAVQAPVLATAGETHRAELLRLASRSLSAERHLAALEIETAFPDPGWMAVLDPDGHWPRRFDLLRVEAELIFDRALDRQALSPNMPSLRAIALTGARIAWAGTDIQATGRIEADLAAFASGHVSGEMDLVVSGWRDLMRRARDAGFVAPEHDLLVSLALMTMVDPQDPDRLRVPLNLRDGIVSIGPVVLGSLSGTP